MNRRLRAPGLTREHVGCLVRYANDFTGEATLYSGPLMVVGPSDYSVGAVLAVYDDGTADVQVHGVARVRVGQRTPPG